MLLALHNSLTAAPPPLTIPGPSIGGTWEYAEDFTQLVTSNGTPLSTYNSAWSVGAGAAADITYSRGAGGFVTVPDDYILQRYGGLTGSPSNYELLCLLRGPWNNYAGLSARGTGTTGYSIEYWAGGAWAIDNASGFLVSQGTPVVVAGERWWIRALVDGTRLRARMWKEGATEPTSGLTYGAWQLDVTDATFTTGAPGLRFGDGGAGGAVIIEAFAAVPLPVAAWAWLVQQDGTLRPATASVSSGGSLHPATTAVT